MTIPIPAFEWVEEIDYGRNRSDPAHGLVNRGKHRDTKLRRFHLSWDNASQTDRDNLLAEYVATKGTAGTTTYTPTPRGEGSAVTVSFINESFDQEWNDPDSWAMSCVLEEQLTPY